MIQGVVNASHEAVVTLSLQVPNRLVHDIEAVVDTGYSGFLTLPTSLVPELELPFAYVGWAFLANDDEVAFDVHDVTIIWDGQPRHIKADATGSTPLLGMLLLDSHDLNIEVINGGRVVIQARPGLAIRWDRGRTLTRSMRVSLTRSRWRSGCGSRRRYWGGRGPDDPFSKMALGALVVSQIAQATVRRSFSKR